MLTQEELNVIFEQATKETTELMKNEGSWKFTPEMINSGYCGYWASFALTHIREKTSEETTPNAYCRFSVDYSFDLPSHTWLYYEGKNYDAECFEGVVDYMGLPIFGRW